MNFSNVLLGNNEGRLAEDVVDFFQGLTLGFRHEQELVDDPKEGDPTVEAQGQPSQSEGVLHLGETVSDSEIPQVQEGRSNSHTDGSGLQVERFSRNNPRQTSIRPEETHVQDQTGEVQPFNSFQMRVQVQSISSTHQNQTNEEPNNVHTPSTSPIFVHPQDRWNGTNQ
ncbi:hypothetical protein WICPIJ_000167 [Wickerhamomyces pijperi]|uniref:Uncharacterized protein n=1 Tax=Wickerhamomyces pijperi TaxID=599730 RepID=A0A9P8TS70_WICPI|nr:hypothetical protein WICPIJ_000167 [Wickerhamomyces pijperi]